MNADVWLRLATKTRFLGILTLLLLLGTAAGCFGTDGDDDPPEVVILDEDTGMVSDSGGGSGGEDGGGTIDCPSGQKACGGSCTKVQSDPQNCGACGNACGQGASCVDGSCTSQPDDCREESCQGLYYCDLSNGKCQPGCDSNEQCGMGETCNIASHDCVCQQGRVRFNGACVTENECNQMFCPGKQYCDLAPGNCKSGCYTDEPCGDNEECNNATNTCQCAAGTTRFKGECVTEQQCNQMFCSGKKRCDLQQGKCVDGCFQDQQCGNNEVCNQSAGTCVCKSGTGRFNGDCVDAQQCNQQFCAGLKVCNLSAGDCEAGCWSDSDCPDTTCDKPNKQCVCDAMNEFEVGGGCLPKKYRVNYGEGEYNTMAADSFGRLHLAYVDTRNDQIWHAHFDGMEWNESKALRTGRFGKGRPSLAVDPGDTPHFSYVSDDKVKYATLKNGSWTEETAATDPSTLGQSSLGFDSQGRPHISYEAYNGNHDVLAYATKQGGQWTTTVVDSAKNTGRASHIAVDSTGTPHISYWDGEGYTLKYATRSGGSWTVETVDGTSRVGPANDIAVDSQDRPHVAYADPYDNLDYATRQGAGNWSTSEATGYGESGRYISLALDAGDDAHISSYNKEEGTWNTKGELVYTYGTPGSFNSTVLESAGKDSRVGTHTQIELLGNYATITYADPSSYDTLYQKTVKQK